MTTSCDDLDLRPGHIHQGLSVSGAVARIWPTPDPDFWHVGLAGYPSQATAKPIPSDLVSELLAQWGFRAERWTSWPGPVHEVNPDLEMVQPKGQSTRWTTEEGPGG